MFERPRQTLWQWIGQGYERFRLKRKIQRLLQPYLKKPNAFVPQFPQEYLSRRCGSALTRLGQPVASVTLMGDNDAFPNQRYKTVGQTLAYVLHADAKLEHRREWIRPLIRQVLDRRFGDQGLPPTLYGRDNAYDLLYFAVAYALAGEPRDELWQLVELACAGNEPAYLLTESDILIVRCQLHGSITILPIEEYVLSSNHRPVPA